VAATGVGNNSKCGENNSDTERKLNQTETDTDRERAIHPRHIGDESPRA
jgi:hypothetical protein